MRTIKDPIDQINAPGNAEMHPKSLVQAALHMMPVLSEAIEQGINENFPTNKSIIGAIYATKF